MFRTWKVFDVPNAIGMWAARTIFHPERKFLDIVHDRTSWHGSFVDANGKLTVPGTTFMAAVNSSAVVEKFSGWASHMRKSDKDVIVRNFEVPEYPDHVIHAIGSPRGSHGYFYLTIALVPRGKEGGNNEPTALRVAKRRKAEEERLEAEKKERAPLLAAYRAKDRVDRKARNRKVTDMVERARENGVDNVEPGEPLGVGDHLMVEANQALRDAFVLAVEYSADEALIQYHMPRSDITPLVVVNRTSHAKIRNVSASKLPKKWKNKLSKTEGGPS